MKPVILSCLIILMALLGGCLATPAGSPLPTPVVLGGASADMRATVAADYARRGEIAGSALEATAYAQSGWAALATYDAQSLAATVEVESMTRQAEAAVQATAAAQQATREALAVEATRVAMYTVATQAALSAQATASAYAMQYAQATYAAEATRATVEKEQQILAVQARIEQEEMLAHQQFQRVVRWVMLFLLVLLIGGASSVGVYLAFKWARLRELQVEPYRVVYVEGRERLLVLNPEAREARDEPLLLPASVPESEPVSGALAALRRADCVLLVGARDTGKTTFALHLATDRLTEGRVVAIDPKPRTPWPNGVEVIGRGYAWGQIDEAFGRLTAEMQTRYQRMRADSAWEPQPLFVFVDEWPSLAANLDDATTALKRLVFEAREAGIRLVLMSQSDDVTTLGIRGQGRLREAFILVRLVKGRDGERTARIEWPDGAEEMYEHPGPFRPNHLGRAQIVPTAPLRPEVVSEERLSWLDQAATAMQTSQRARQDGLALLSSGPFGSRNAAAVALFGVARASQNEYTRLEAALRWLSDNRPEALGRQDWLRQLVQDAGLSFGD